MRPIIRVENLGKEYRIGTKRTPYLTLRDSLTELARERFARLRGEPKAADKSFWALKDVNLEIRPGEVVGIIGRNGAGKSTLLKVLSRIIEPTTGAVDLYGRVSSLLEVGTGFHPELTGRENVYLNGSILGMSRKEIARKFDEIVEFAEIEEFLETPVKRYSSGMYVRLAFAVAAHLEPEILIVDEVLAVGDTAFQKKCLAKMQKVGSNGRTILFVSHDMQAITRLCPLVALFDRGKLVAFGPASAIISQYLESGIGINAQQSWPEIASAPGDLVARLRAVRVRDEAGQVSEAVDIRKKIGVEMEFDVLQAGHVLVPNFHFFNEERRCIFVVHDVAPPWRGKERPKGRYTSTAWVPGNFLSEGMVLIDAALSSFIPGVKIHIHGREVMAIQVVDSLDGDSARGDFRGPIPGLVRPILEWTNTFHGAAGLDSSLTLPRSQP
jgi:lipopolysaccharide transport system ATP-binding protein